MRRGSSHIHLKPNPYQKHCSGFKIQLNNLMKKKLQQIRMKT
ncbi:hypothetical protein Gotur_003258 [Gossypium turneri]